MGADYIVEEVRAIREAIAREHGDNVKAIVEALVRKEAENKTRVVSLPPKPLSGAHAGRKAG